MIRTLADETAAGPGQYTYYLDLDVKGWPPGEYSLRIYEDANVRMLKEFKI